VTTKGLLPILLLAMSVARPAIADDGPKPPEKPLEKPADTDTDEARRLFGVGVDAVKRFQWADALTAFEKSHALVPNATTSLNIGVSERSLGHYVRSKRALGRALEEHRAAGGTVLSPSSVADAEGYLKEIDGLLARATVTVKPEGSNIVVDGRPLTKEGRAFAAGIEAPGKGAPAPAGKFDLVLDPGNHVFVLTRKGFSDAVVNRTFAPGATLDLVLELDKLPATIKVSAEVEGAIVRVGRTDVGPAPVDVLRPAGTYPVTVSKEGFVTYETTLTVKAGEEAKIDAVLPKKKLAVEEEWWFWVSIAGAVGTAATITYFAVRPEPDPLPYDGGNTGWVVPSVIRF
jgi:hypothetical protein